MNRRNSQKPQQQTIEQCPGCHQYIQHSLIQNHITDCKQYIPTYLNSVNRFMQLMTPNYMKFLEAELKEVQERLVKQIEVNREKNNKEGGRVQMKGINKQEINIQKEKEKVVQKKQKQLQAQINKKILSKESKQVPIQPKLKTAQIQNTLQLQQYNSKEQQFINAVFDQKIECVYPKCSKPVQLNDFTNFRYLDECLHSVCLSCIRNYINQNYIKSKGDIVCPKKDCNAKIPVIQIKEILDPTQLIKLENQLNSKAMDLVECQKCHERYQFIKGKPSDAPKKTAQGKAITPSMAKYFAQFRFQCPKCREEQCKTCKVAPFHLGFTCQQFAEHKLKKKCRYCREVLPKGYMSETGISTLDDICDSEACSTQAKQACSKRLKCGHPCFGVIRQKSCPPCLNQKCAKANSQRLHGQNQNSYCSLCYVQSLAEAPCIMSKCGHIFHVKCLKHRLQLKWGSPRITFRFCECPLCNKWLELPEQSSLSKMLVIFKQLHQKIAQKAIKRLKHQGMDKDQKLKDKDSPYFQNQFKYSTTIYAYFQCFTCHQPYFGGRKSCAQAMQQAAGDKKFDPKQLICPSCCPIQLTDCKKHGKQYISFKCKFCCSVAQWFCWGNTHFCDNCHKRQIAGQYISRLAKDKLPKCEGKDKCPVGGEHGGNGDQFCLGCGICRGEKMDFKDF